MLPTSWTPLGRGTELEQGIAQLYNESSGVWESVWGEHMHTGYAAPPPFANQRCEYFFVAALTGYSGVKYNACCRQERRERFVSLAVCSSNDNRSCLHACKVHTHRCTYKDTRHQVRERTCVKHVFTLDSVCSCFTDSLRSVSQTRPQIPIFAHSSLDSFPLTHARLSNTHDCGYSLHAHLSTLDR